MSIYGITFILILIFIELFHLSIDFQNHTHINRLNLDELEDIYSIEELKKSLEYHNAKFFPSTLHSIVDIGMLALLFYSGIIQRFDYFLYNHFNDYLHAIFLFTGFSIFNYIVGLPFVIYDTFFIEKRFGFNKMTPLIFIRDTILSSLIGFIFSSIVLSAIIFFIKSFTNTWVFVASIFMVGFMLFTTYIYPTLIAPLFNKFTPLENKELADKIFNLAKKANFPLKNILQMDASKRSTHSNAYFTGLGKNKRIVLFDTLLEKHSESELLAILGHEIGHYKLGHIKKMLFLSCIFIVLGFTGIKLLIDNSFIYESLGFAKSIPSGIFVISILFSPISFLLSPFLMKMSRKHEFEADSFSYKLTEDKLSLKEALIKLHKDNLSFPYPHKLYVVFNYSHPPLTERIKNLL
ncbi:MAG: endopeptidase [Deferribacteres bacterium]|jgi:STE24 endopeptidase|nr:Ste24 endopeptidase [Deferribacteraceae bacterium]MDK2793098.1 endopeptidase [Deferribacteres bacterium]